MAEPKKEPKPGRGAGRKRRYERYKATGRREANKARRARARAARLARRGAEVRAAREARAAADHLARHLRKHGLGAVEACELCAAAGFRKAA